MKFGRERKLTITTNKGDYYVLQCDVLCIMADDNTCIVYHLEGENLVTKKISQSLVKFVAGIKHNFLYCIGQDCHVNPIHVSSLLKDRSCNFYHPDAPTVYASRRY